jgi:hypothetical protein
VEDNVKLTGVGASEGVVAGPAFVDTAGKPEPTRKSIPEDSVEVEDEYMAARADDARDVASQIAPEPMGRGTPQRLHISNHRIYTFRSVAFIETWSYYVGQVKVRGLEVRR